MVLAGTLPPIRGLILLPAQLLAGMCAAALVQCMFPGDITLTNTTLSPGTSIAQGVFIEMFMTAELVFVVLMLAAEKSKDTFMAPIGIGLALFVAMLGGMLHLSCSLNVRCASANSQQVFTTLAARSTLREALVLPLLEDSSRATTGSTGSARFLVVRLLRDTIDSSSTSTTRTQTLGKIHQAVTSTSKTKTLRRRLSNIRFP